MVSKLRSLLLGSGKNLIHLAAALATADVGSVRFYKMVLGRLNRRVDAQEGDISYVSLLLLHVGARTLNTKIMLRPVRQIDGDSVHRGIPPSQLSALIQHLHRGCLAQKASISPTGRESRC